MSHGGRVPCWFTLSRAFALAGGDRVTGHGEVLAGGSALCPSGCPVAWPRVGGDEPAGAEVENREIYRCFPSKAKN